MAMPIQVARLNCGHLASSRLTEKRIPLSWSANDKPSSVKLLVNPSLDSHSTHGAA
jgi:hypothetical protein